MDSELARPQVYYPTGPIVTGRVIRLMDGYPREVRIGQPVLVAVITAASVMGLLLMLVRSVASIGGGGSRRSWKDLRKGPEFLVTPLRLRDDSGRVFEMELHGHLPQSALHPADHVQITVRRQRDPDLAPRVERIVNLTTAQLLRPRTPTLWSHLGPPLLLQAVLGALVVATVTACAAITG